MTKINPNSPAYKALLLQSAINILKGTDMAKHARHNNLPINKPSTGNAFDLSVKDVVGGTSTGRLPPASNNEAEASEEGVDNSPSPGVQSGFSIFNPAVSTASTSKEKVMAKAPKTAPQATAPVTSPEAQAAANEAAAKKAADKEAADKAKAEAKAKREAEAAAKKAAKEAAAKAKAEQAAAKKAERDARIAELQAAGKKYVGSMLALSDKVKSGHYVKSITGQLRSNDDLAVALDGVTPNGVIKLGLALLELPENPYVKLNVGQQSMNLRNRLRGAVKKGTLTIEKIKVYVAEHELDVSGEINAKKEAAAKAKAEREAAAAAKKEATAKAKQSTEQTETVAA